MKKVNLSNVLTLLFTTLFFVAIVITPFIGNAKEYKDMTDCEKLQHNAKLIMAHRQNGTELSDMINKAGDNSVYRDIILDAYSDMQYSQYDFQQRAIKRFGERYYLACLKIGKN